jgi:hypothetical protein
VRINAVVSASEILLCWALLLPQPSASQMPAPLGRLHITSKPDHATITINGTPRKETTNVTLAVVPNTYTIVIGTCPEKPVTVTVASGETKEVYCGQ